MADTLVCEKCRGTMRVSEGFAFGELRQYICASCGAQRLISTDMIAKAKAAQPAPDAPAPQKSVPAQGSPVIETERLTLPRTVGSGNDEYEVYFAPTAAAAKQRIGAMPVTKPHYYIVIETPESNFGRDCMGEYQPQRTGAAIRLPPR